MKKSVNHIFRNMDIYVITKVFLLCTLCELIVSKKINLPDLSKQSLIKINDCQRCKVLTDSFAKWLEKTSRGKFEGGDAAWEETKLKSYARSEIRLVEIQEGLCSEVKKHQDQCYSLAEEAEQVLEDWWFKDDPNSVDLYTWLCIETLQDCCPQNHFGDSCTPCLVDKNNKVCGGNGRCDGDGTRKGTGSCLCKRGFTGRSCEECAKNFYLVDSGSCESCDKACEGCSGKGAGACNACKSGWQLEADTCIDVNECLNPSSCESNKFCINEEGFHTCKACDKSCKTCVGPESTNCTSCNPNSLLWSGVCVDEELRNELMFNTLKRLSLYFALIVITLFLSRTGSLTSIMILVIAIFIYTSEKSSKMNIVDVISNIYF